MEAMLAEERMIDLEKFVSRSGWERAELFPMKGDASFRRYTRLVMDNEKALLMDAPKPQENIDAYLDMTEHLKSLGCRVPKIYAEDRDLGFAIIEDFGDDTFKRLLTDTNYDETALYLKAIDVLKHIHATKAATNIKLPLYDRELLLREVMLFVEWFVPKVSGSTLSGEDNERYRAVWLDVLDHVADDNSVLVLRDYFVDNLMLVEGEGSLDECALLDYQDAVLGSPAYDLVSLIEDARRDISPDVRRAVLAHYFDGNQNIDRLKMLEAISILGAQRHAKVLGIFTRLSERDQKHGYLMHLPRVQKLFARSLASPKLAAVREVVFDLVPNLGEIVIAPPEADMNALKPPVA
ncbi:aminoglycoside phosphotransferase family protein [Kordiimonas sp. SCSIO 12610]|uniref:aminoglycoside phosphotransferase family protein n=1 Tax=Kordiimonas sp. SCSIO 12610 TaxID=2829597 RepID=UPI002108AF72|nr:phosphotransferase [Kordiimonas sp. SCSIO 12610]UTW56357.1 phosphotransferase [Kordiimonas sp. SCSIO 12610]